MQALIIIGQKSSGKTTLAQQLSDEIGLPQVDLDALMLAEYPECDHIAHLYEKMTNESFRHLEYKLLESYWRKAYLISCGGGVITYAPSRNLLKKSAYTLFWDTPISLCIARLQARGQAYLSSLDPTIWQKMMEERTALYQQAASYTATDFAAALRVAHEWKNRLISTD